MRTDPARSRARKARRVEKAAENAGLAAATGKEPIIASKQGLEATPRLWGSRDVTFPINQPNARKSKPRRKNSPSLSKLKKLLWTEISLLVRSWSPVCFIPGCGEETQCAAHIVPANDGAATRFFLPNLYPCCFPHNEAERRQRGSWVYKHRQIFGDDFVDALYALSETTFQLKKHWVLEQTERMKKLRGIE